MRRKRPGTRGRIGRRFPLSAVLVAVLVAVSPVVIVEPVDQETQPPVLVDPYTLRWVAPERVEQNHVDFSHPATYCIVGSDRLGCSLAQIVTRTYTVTGELGLDAGYISTSLSISESDSISISANCNSPNARPGTRLVAYPTETYHYYHVIEEQGDNVRQETGQIEYPAYPRFGQSSMYPSEYVAIPDGGVYCRVEPL